MATNSKASRIPCEHNHPETFHMQSLGFPCNDAKCRCRCNDCDKRPTKEISRMCGLSTAVVDDPNEVTYIYGNIIYEPYHVPQAECSPYLALPTNMSTFRNLVWDKFIGTGPFINNQVALTYTPSPTWPEEVYVNGVMQVPGDTHDYTLAGNTITFAQTLGQTDTVYVKYRYERLGQNE